MTDSPHYLLLSESSSFVEPGRWRFVLRSADDGLNRQLAHVKRIASDLQRHTMSMRMVPIRQTFQKMTLPKDASFCRAEFVGAVLN